MGEPVKLIAFYLPQFHRIKENDEWWGESYTEWTAVKRARPLFRNHYQPREPYNDNYYDLTDPRVTGWQQDLAREYGISGFCYYHYWFMGRKLLEKPLEQMLRDKKLDFPFCLSWANQSWTRTWYGRETDVLIQQEYGQRQDWRKHFEYLLPILQDQRYIRVEGKPVFLIHDPLHIGPCHSLMDYWTDLAVHAGLGGLYFVQTLGGFPVDRRVLHFDAQVQFEPGYTMVNGLPRATRIRNLVKWKARALLRKHGFDDRSVDAYWDYDDIYENITARMPTNHRTTFLGAFTDWDNSPRRGFRSSVFRGANPVKFQRYLTRQIIRSQKLFHSEFLFINAWNEWGEGAYLEPDKRYGTGYLQAVRNGISEASESF